VYREAIEERGDFFVKSFSDVEVAGGLMILMDAIALLQMAARNEKWRNGEKT